MELLSSSFPEGLRVLVVDDDTTCLKIVVKMLQKCKYLVTACDQPSDALSLLREKSEDFDMVITDVWMPGMDGFKLLEHISLELDIPVIMMSADSERDTVLKGLNRGACFYLAKPVRVHELTSIWQHVARKKMRKTVDVEPIATVEENEVQSRRPDNDVGFEYSANEGKGRKGKKKKKRGWRNEEEYEQEDDDEERKDAKEDDQADGPENENVSTHKKARVLWSAELHEQFLEAVNRIGIDRAVPKKILEIMKVPGLTRENIASHLQKYRLYLKRVEEARQYGLGSFKPPNRPSPRSVFGPLPILRPSRPSIFGHSGLTLNPHSYTGLLNPYAPMAMSSINNLLSRFTNRQQQENNNNNNNNNNNVNYASLTDNPFVSSPLQALLQSESLLQGSNIQMDPSAPQVGGNNAHDGTSQFGCNEFLPRLGSCRVGLEGIKTDAGLPQFEFDELWNAVNRENNSIDNVGMILEGELERILEDPHLQQEEQEEEQQQLNTSNNFTWGDFDGFDGAKSFAELIQGGSYPLSNGRASDESLADALQGFLGESNSLLRQFSNGDLGEEFSKQSDDGNDVNIVADQGSTST